MLKVQLKIEQGAIRKFVERDHGTTTGTVEAALKNDSMVMEAKVYALNDDGSFKKPKMVKKERSQLKILSTRVSYNTI